jgi:hypothetical protein
MNSGSRGRRSVGRGRGDGMGRRLLHERGRRNKEVCHACPVTASTIEQHRTIRTHAGLSYFSRMRGGTHIAAHRLRVSSAAVAAVSAAITSAAVAIAAVAEQVADHTIDRVDPTICDIADCTEATVDDIPDRSDACIDGVSSRAHDVTADADRRAEDRPN